MKMMAYQTAVLVNIKVGIMSEHVGMYDKGTCLS